MKYQPPFVYGAAPGSPGIHNSDPDAGYVNGDPSIGQEGSYIPCESIEHVQREIIAQIESAALTPDHGVLTQLRQAIARSASGATWFASTGAANAYTLAAPGPFDVPTSPFLGQAVRTIPNHTNTGAATATFAGVTKAIRTWQDKALAGGELGAGRLAEAVYDPAANSGAGALLLMPWAVANGVLAALPTGSLTLYVRTDGSDTNDGSTNDAAHAFATILAAINYARRSYALSGAVVTIQLGNAGTYAAFAVASVGGRFVVRGDPANRAAYVISGTGAGQSGVVSVTGASSEITLQGVSVANTAGTVTTLYAAGGGSIVIDAVRLVFNANTPPHQINVNTFGIVVVSGDLEVKGNASSALLRAYADGLISFNVGSTLTIQDGNSVGTTVLATGGTILFSGTIPAPNVSSGKRYDAQVNGKIITGGGGANFFPGTVAGTTATGGQYT